MPRKGGAGKTKETKQIHPFFVSFIQKFIEERRTSNKGLYLFAEFGDYIPNANYGVKDDKRSNQRLENLMKTLNEEAALFWGGKPHVFFMQRICFVMVQLKMLI